jgi:hypothetical protein
MFKFRCNIIIGVRIIKEMPGLVGSETPCILAVNVRAIKKNIEALVDVTMETGIEVINDTKYMVMSSDQDAGQRI